MSDSFIKIVVGTKIDLEGERCITRESGLEFSVANGATYLETSAKTGLGIQAAFQLICEKLLQSEMTKASSGHGLELADEPRQKKKECCD
jgi:GTPase SAR1 family protein